jgi:membrane protein
MTDDARKDHVEGRGREAVGPSHIPLEGWKDILWRIWLEFFRDRVSLVAAGVTFYLLLALFPALAVFVSLYGYLADPVSISEQLSLLSGVLPTTALDMIRRQLDGLVTQNTAALSLGFLFGFLVALWSANNGVKALFEAMNVAYQESEKRSFVRLNLLALLFTIGTFVVAGIFLFAVGVVPAMLGLVGLNSFAEGAISLLRWPILFVVASLGISLLYRYGPSRELAKWRWISWGSVFATMAWLSASILFSWYLGNFANYNATYGSLGAIVGVMMWTWVSVVVLIVGAEVNAEMEHQTARDSTTGPEMPMGSRGATMADTLGKIRRDPDRDTTAP